MNHDLKNLLRRKKFLRRLFPSQSRNQTLRSALVESKLKKRRLAVALPLIAVLLAIIPIRALVIPGREAKAERPRYLKDLDHGTSFSLSVAALDKAHPEGGKLRSVLPDGGTVDLSIDPELQDRVVSVMRKNSVPYGVFVAIEPRTGRVLSYASHSDREPGWEKGCFTGVYPMASLFKIVTAAAAIEQKKVNPDSVVFFRGRNTSENPRYWEVKSERGAQKVNLSVAMGKSINPVFGRLADVVGKDSIVSMAGKFGFNHELFPGTGIPASTAPPPRDDAELQLMGAGLGREVKVSLLHAATIMAAIANNGVMMRPVMADRMVNGKGDALLRQSEVTATVLDPETNRQLAKTLSLTVRSGTSRKAFHDRRGRPKLASVNVAAKTGSINGKQPEGHYSWFAAYAPAEDPQIALVALVINQDRWKIKASDLGEQALEEFFR